MDVKVKKILTKDTSGEGDLITILPKEQTEKVQDSMINTFAKNYVTACWIFILVMTLAITVLVGMSYLNIICLKNHSEFFDTKHAQGSEVFYPEIVSFGCKISYGLYAQNLAKVAKKFPSLNFSMLFLFDDKILPKIENGKFFDSLFFHSQNFEIAKDKNLQTILKEHKNINLKTGLLSKFLEETPMKSKWRKYPLNYLKFYIRTYAVWHRGGIGIDLRSFCEPSFLQQKNNQKTIVMDMFNELFSTKKDKDSKNVIESKAIKTPDIATNNVTAVNKTDIKNDIQDLLSPSLFINHSKEFFINNDVVINPFEMISNMEIPMMMDFGFNDNNAMTFTFGFSAMQEIDENPNFGFGEIIDKLHPYFLSLDKKGSFIASVNKAHPFLGKLLKNIPPCSFFSPEFVILGVYSQNCEVAISDYCASIHFI